MSVDEVQKRLNAIKLKYEFFPVKCDYCEEYYKREKMWKFYRYEENRTYQTHYYCQNCMSSKEDVLNEIDSDESPFGIAGVDDFLISKRDYTRMEFAKKIAFKIN